MPLSPFGTSCWPLTQRVYGGRNVAYTEEADREINRLTELGFGRPAGVRGQDPVQSFR